MERKIEFSVGEYYHVYNRGVEKRTIFLDNNDRDRFSKLLFVSNDTQPFIFRDLKNKTFGEIKRDKPLIAIGAYCLMPNHFHMLVKETGDGGLSSFMEKITTAYSKYFNTRHHRVGPLFQSRFKAEHIDRDEYLKYLFAYIHLNPVKLIEPHWKEKGIKESKKVQEYLRNFSYSSYQDYLGIDREEKLILSEKDFPEYFEKAIDFKAHIKDWLEFSAEEFIFKDESERQASLFAE